jgi:hypothetical protein
MRARGVVPVTIQVPRLGQEVRFERLLVINEAPSIAVDYRRGACGCCSASAAE